MALDTIEERQREVEQIHAEVFGKQKQRKKNHNPKVSRGGGLEDQQLIEKARTAKNGNRFSSLYEGDITGHDSQSEVDLAYCNHLAFWTDRNSEQMDRIFRMSGLMRNKWDEKHNSSGNTYGQMTIQKAIDNCTETYESREEREAIQAESVVTEKKYLKKKPKGRTLQELKKEFEYGERIEFVWREHIPKGMPVILGGREGSGKTTNALAMGKEMIDEHEKGLDVWLATEGVVLDTISKMDAMEIANERFVIAQRSDDSFKWELSRHSDQKELNSLLESYEEPILAVFIDSIRAMSKYGDNDDGVGKVIHEINAIVCDKYRAGLVYLDHHKKGAAATLLDKNSGTTAKTSAVRAVYAIKKESKLVASIIPAKVNIFYEIPELTSIKQGDKIRISAKETLSDNTMTGKGEIFLADLFSKNSEMFVRDVYNMGEAEGLSPGVLKKAKKNLGCIKVSRVDNTGPWIWKWEN
jgi:hypothetical protein